MATDYGLAVMVSAMAAVAVVLFLNMTGVGLVRPYFAEYEACRADLKVATTPDCAPCECHSGWLGVVWAVIGGFVLLGSYLMSLWFNKKAEDRRALARAERDRLLEQAKKEASFILKEAKAAAKKLKGKNG